MTNALTAAEIEMVRYPFTVLPDAEGGYVIVFPDLPGCMTQVESIEEIPHMAEDALRGWITVAYEDGQDIPAPSTEDEVKRLRQALDAAVAGQQQAERAMEAMGGSADSLMKHNRKLAAQANGDRDARLAAERRNADLVTFAAGLEADADELRRERDAAVAAEAEWRDRTEDFLAQIEIAVERADEAERERDTARAERDAYRASAELGHARATAAEAREVALRTALERLTPNCPYCNEIGVWRCWDHDGEEWRCDEHKDIDRAFRWGPELDEAVVQARQALAPEPPAGDAAEAGGA